MSLKKKLAMAVVTTTAGAAIIAAGSFALFTDSVSNTGNTFTAGKLSISTDDLTDGTAGGAFTTDYGFELDELAPGDVIRKTIEVTNDGDLNEWVRVVATEDGELFKAQGSGATLDVNHATVDVEEDAQMIVPDAKATFTVTVELPKEAGNLFQQLPGTVDLSIDAVQHRNNEGEDGTEVQW